MRQKTLDVLEFNKIKALIANETISDLGRRESTTTASCD